MAGKVMVTNVKSHAMVKLRQAVFTARSFRQKLYTLFRSDPRGATANDPYRQKSSVRDHTFPASIMIRSGVGLRVYC